MSDGAGEGGRGQPGQRADLRPSARAPATRATASSGSGPSRCRRASRPTFTRALGQEFQAESSVKNVSASFGRQIAEGAILAIIVSLLLITLYISLRFQPKFAGPVMVSLLHDVLITVGIYALLGREVTTATVAAVLTVLGYSIYDTIIIFDRIRENIPLMRRASFRTMANVSLWETIPRSLATTFITLLPISALYFFGGETLKDFAFALLVGIGAGAYSSIFIAAPLLAMLKEREPEYARRRDDAGLTDAGSVGGLLREAEELAAARPTPDLIPGRVPGRRTARRRRAAAPEPPRPLPTSRSASADANDVPPVLMAAPDNTRFALRQLLEELGAQLRNSVEKLGELPQETGERLARELGLARREELEALELRVAQLEHRLKLLEKQP